MKNIVQFGLSLFIAGVIFAATLTGCSRLETPNPEEDSQATTAQTASTVLTSPPESPSDTPTSDAAGMPEALPQTGASTATPPSAAYLPAAPQSFILARLGFPFELRLNETAMIEAEGLAVTFVRVVEDSRCPHDMDCVWAGQVIVALALAQDGQDLGELNLTLGAELATPAPQLLGAYLIQILAVDPYPQSLGGVLPDEYVVTLQVDLAP